MARSNFFCGTLYQKMSDDLHLTSKAQRTHDGYLREIRKLADHYRLAPDNVSEQQLRRYFLFLKNEKQLAEGSLTVTLSAKKAAQLTPAATRSSCRFAAETKPIVDHDSASTGLLEQRLRTSARTSRSQILTCSACAHRLA